MELDIRRYLRLVARWWWLLVVSAAIPMGVGYYLASQQQDVYQAKATIMVGSSLFQDPNPDLHEISLSNTLAAAYAELVRQGPVTQAVIARLGLERSPETLASQIATGIRSGAHLLEIYVTDTNAEAAAVIANALADELIRRSPASGGNDPEQQAFIRGQLEELQAKIANIGLEIDEATASLVELTSAAEIQDAQDQIAALEEVRALYQSTYAGLLDVYRTESPNVLSLFEPAVVPQWPMPSKTKLIVAVSGVAGIALALIAVFIMEYLDTSLRLDADGVESILGLPVLGVVPHASSKRPLVASAPLSSDAEGALPDGPNLSEAEEARPERPSVLNAGEARPKRANVLMLEGARPKRANVLMLEGARPKRANVLMLEGVRAMRANVFLLRPDDPFRTLLLTSPVSSEDKSIVLANLAVVLAAAGNRVVVVDADMRSPALHELFDLPNVVGLADLLSDQAPGDGTPSPVILQETAFDDVVLLSAGRPPADACSLLTSPRLPVVLDWLNEHGDVILIDSPPVLGPPDATVLATRVEGTILVVSAGQTKRQKVQHAKEHLTAQQGVNLLGLAVNGISPRGSHAHNGRGLLGRMLKPTRKRGDGVWLTLGEAAERLGISKSRARQWAKSGRLPATRKVIWWQVDGDGLQDMIEGIVEGEYTDLRGRTYRAVS